MTKKKLYAWMDKQIKAAELQSAAIIEDDPYYIMNASVREGTVHVYGIDNLCKELKVSYIVEDHSSEYNCHYIMYKGYKFFGLVEKGEDDNEGK